MWIALRLVLAVVGYVVRSWTRRTRPASEHAAYDLRLDERKGKITGFKIGMPRRSPSWIRFHAEGAVDRLVKALGLASEAQTGDEAFDRRVYVTCDHPLVRAALRDTPALRAAIVDAFDAGFASVELDGASLWLARKATALPTDADVDRLAAVHAASVGLAGRLPGPFGDRFLWKAFAVEGVIWSIFGYAIGAFVELFVHGEDYHLRPSEVVVRGLSVALLAFVVLVVVIAWWLRGSSRGHRIIIESALVLAIGLPTTCIQLVSETNRRLDRRPAVSVEARIERCEERVHRRRRGGRTYSYHLWLGRAAAPAGAPALPAEVKVTRSLCYAAPAGAVATFEIGPGRWGLPWYRTIRSGDEIWTAP